MPSDDVVPLAGDWNGDRRDGLALFRRADATFIVFDDSIATDGAATPSVFGAPWPVQYGQPSDFPLVGDWDGDGRDSIGVYHSADSTYHLDGFSNHPLMPAGPITFGRSNMRGAVPIAGDWNGRDVVSLAELSALYGATVHPLVLIANLTPLNTAMIKSGAVTPARKAAFLAMISSESGFRADAVQDGARRYRGRGFVQLSGETNYRRRAPSSGWISHAIRTLPRNRSRAR